MNGSPTNPLKSGLARAARTGCAAAFSLAVLALPISTSAGSDDCNWKPPGNLATNQAMTPAGSDDCYWKPPGNLVTNQAMTMDGFEKGPQPVDSTGKLTTNDDLPTIADTPCSSADVNADQFVNEHDLIMVLNGWGAHTGDADCNGDGCVDALDLIAVLAAWGVCG